MNDRDVLREYLRRQKAAGFALEKLTHPKQLRAITSPARRKAICAGRRGGKTYGIDLADLHTASRLGWRNLYVTLTRANAKELAWEDLVALNDEYSLGGEVHLQDLSLTWRNGGLIALRGANNEREIAKIRGKKWHRVKIDECQSIPDRILGQLLGPILAPTLLDFGGELWMSGSRPAVRAGIWFDVTEGRLRGNYEQHRFDIRDNTLLPSRRAGRSIDDILAEFRADQGWTEDDITYRREVLNEDVEDLDSLLFQFETPRNTYSELPGGNWTYAFGVDQGHDDSDAIAVLGWTDADPRLFLVEEFVQAKQDVTDLAEAIKERIPLYNPISITIDQGGGGKKSAEEIRRRHHVVMDAAEKSNKPQFIRLLNADLRKGLVVARDGSRFASDCKLVQKDPRALMRGLLQEKPVSQGGYHSDICDAVLYAWRSCRHFRFEPAAPPPPVEDQLEEAVLEEHERAAAEDWLETDFERIS